MNLDTNDLQYVDALESVSFLQPAAGTPTLITGALRRQVTTREAEATDGVYTRSDVHWHLPTSELPTAPQLGATITDSENTIWTVLAVSPTNLDANWRCQSRNLALTENLQQRITIQHANWTQDAAGTPIPIWTTKYVDIPVRIQPQQQQIEVTNGRRTARVTHKIYLAGQLLVDDNDRILHDNTVYNILGYQQPDRIDQLFVIDAEQVPWPLSAR